MKMLFTIISVFLTLCVSPVINDPIWHSYDFSTGSRDRHELMILDIKSDGNFREGRGVYRWKSLRVGKRNFALGLMPFGVTAMVAEASENEERFNTVSRVLDFDEIPTDVTLFEHWNSKMRKSEIISIISTYGNFSKMHWFTFSDDATMDKIFSWTPEKKIVHLQFFTLGPKERLLTIGENHDITSADVYEFLITENFVDIWHIQKLVLSNPTNSTALTAVGPDLFLSIPQKSLDMVIIYKFSNDHFVPFKRVTCPQATNVVSFKIGFKSYLAIGGAVGGIFKFTKNSLMKEELADSSLDGVHFWHKISLANFRSDVILLAQRLVDHETHNSLSLGFVLQNSGKFFSHEEITCAFHGESLSGLRCLADEERSSGIIGLTTLSSGKMLGLLVPRENAPSGLLMLRTKVDFLPDPLDFQVEKLMETRKKLTAMMVDQDNQILGVQSRTKEPEDIFLEEELPMETIFSQVDREGTPVFSANRNQDFSYSELDQQLSKIKNQIAEMKEKLTNHNNHNKQTKRYKQVIFNGIVVAESGGNFDRVFADNIKGENSKSVLDDIVKIDNIHHIPSVKAFEDLKMHDLEVQNINGISTKDFVYSDDNEATINGVVVFQERVVIEGDLIASSDKVNDVILKNEVIQTQRFYPDTFLNFEEIQTSGVETNEINGIPMDLKSPGFLPDSSSVLDKEMDSLYIPGNVTAERVNGINFNQFRDSLCLRNLKTYVKGDITIDTVDVTGNAYTNFLNGLHFPQEFTFQKPEGEFTEFTGNKLFLEPIRTVDVTAQETINGIKPDTIVTLSQFQEIPEMLTFTDLQVAETLDVDPNKIVGWNREHYLPNPTLSETNNVSCSVNFEHLEVVGVIIVEDNFNGTNFKSSLSDIVYKEEIEPVISSVKQFPNGLTVNDNFEVKTEFINNIPMEQFFTSNTEQTLEFKQLNGTVRFEKLLVTGLIDGINITKLTQETVKTFGQQYISANLTFDDFTTSVLEVTEKLNNVPVEDFVSRKGNRTFENILDFENLLVHNLSVKGNASLEINAFNIADFDKRRLSISRDQAIPANATLGQTSAFKLEANFINDVLFQKLFKRNYAKNLGYMLREEKIKIKELHIKGSLQIDTVNGIGMDMIMNNMSWRGKMTVPGTKLIIKGDASFGRLQTDNFNQVHFDSFASAAVFRNETDLELNGYKIFTNGFDVEKFIETDKLNNVLVTNVLSKVGKQTVFGPVTIHGNVIVDYDTQINENLNDIPLQYIRDIFEEVDGGYKINGDVFFDRLTYVKNLNISGFANEIYLNNLLENMVDVNQNAILLGDTIFEDEVEIQENLEVTGGVNDVVMQFLESDAVLVTKDDIVEGTVTFKDPVVLEGELIVETDLWSRFVDDIDLQYWLDSSVFINKGLLIGNFTFEEASIENGLFTKFINDVDVEDLMSTSGDQYISQNIEIGESVLYNDMEVGNLVNGYILENEIINTVLTGPDQEIHSDIIFTNAVLAYDSVQIDSPQWKKLVTTNTEQNLTAIYKYSGKTLFEDNLNCYGNIDDINLTYWFNNDLKKNSPYPQIINTEWNVGGNITFDNIEGDGLINEMNFRIVSEDLEERKRDKFILERKLIEGYQDVCGDVGSVLKFTKKQIYAFKYLEEIQTREFSTYVKNAHHFSFNGQLHLLVNVEENCLGHLFVWEADNLEHLYSFATGVVSQVVTVRVDEDIYLVTRGSSSCLENDANVWRFTEEILEHIFKLDDVLLLQESNMKNTFYGLDGSGVTEYKILSQKSGDSLRRHRKWLINENNLAFVPRGLQTGPALRNGEKMFQLIRDNVILNSNLAHEIETVFIGKIEEKPNDFLPGSADGDIIVMNVGVRDNKRTLVAVTTHDETSVPDGFDLIKIYDDVLTGSVFQILPAYKPSSPIFLNFNNGETLLMFLEDEKILQIYEYKGIEGFKPKSSANVGGRKLFVMDIPTKNKIVGIINKNKVVLLEALMMGNRLEENDLSCEL